MSSTQLADAPFVQSTKLIEGCAVCGKKNDLRRCSACKVISYCGLGHQASDRPSHKAFCSKIKKAKATFESEERKLRSFPGDQLTPENPLETCVGHFWGVIETRDYMRARFALVDATLNKINTKVAVASSLDHLLDMLRLCRGDNMGLRDIVPALYLRLGRDQDCYDFCKWWASKSLQRDYEWGNTELPFLDTKDADVFEGVELWSRRFTNLSHLLAVMLVKVRLLIDLQTLQRMRSEARLPASQESLDEFMENAVSSVVKGNSEILERDDHSAQIAELTKQVKQLYDSGAKVNKYIWPAMRNPGRHLTTRPMLMSPESVEEMQVKLQYNYNAWLETPGSISFIV